jgi:hypothetical protein
VTGETLAEYIAARASWLEIKATERTTPNGGWEIVLVLDGAYAPDLVPAMLDHHRERFADMLHREGITGTRVR